MSQNGDSESYAFNTALNTYANPSSKCHTENYPFKEKNKFCDCISEANLNKFSKDDYLMMMEEIKSAADMKQADYVNINLQLLKNKVLSSLEQYHRFKGIDGKIQTSCTPDILIGNFNKAVNSCSEGEKKGVKRITENKTPFKALDLHFNQLNKEFASKKRSSTNPYKQHDKLIVLLEKAHKYNTGKLNLGTADLDKLEEEIGIILDGDTLLRDYSVKLEEPITGMKRVINSDGIVSKEGRSGQSDLLTTIINKAQNTAMLTLTDKPLSTDKLKEAFEENLIDLSSENSIACYSIISNVTNICNSAENIKHFISTVQKDQKHLAKIIYSISGEKIYGKNIYDKTQDLRLHLKNGDINLMSSSFNLDSSNTAVGDAIMTNQVSALQCSLAFPDKVNGLIDGEMNFDDKSRNKNLFTTITDKTTAAEYSYIGNFNGDSSKDYLNTFLNHNPSGKIGTISKISQKKTTKTYTKNNLVTTDSSVGTSLLRGAHNWSARGETKYISPTENLSTPEQSGSSSAEIINSTGNPEEPNQSSEVPERQLILPSTGISSLPQIGLTNKTETNKASTEQLEERDAPQDTSMQEYKARMDKMMQKMAELTEKKEKSAVSTGKDVKEEDEKMVGLEKTIASLKTQIMDLKKKKPIVKEAPKATTSIGIRPFAHENNNQSSSTRSTPAQASSTQSKPATSQQSVIPSRQSASQQRATDNENTSTSITSSGGGKSSEFSLSSEKINLEGKFTVSAKDFNLSDKGAMTELFQRSNGKPIYVTQTLPDGSKEVVIYEATKDKDGNMAYKPKRIGPNFDPTIAKKKTEKKAKKKEKSRKRMKVEDLNKLIDQSK